MPYVYRIFLPLRLVAVSLLYIRRFIFKFFNVCPYDYTAIAGSGKVGPVNRLTTPVG